MKGFLFHLIFVCLLALGAGSAYADEPPGTAGWDFSLTWRDGANGTGIIGAPPYHWGENALSFMTPHRAAPGRTPEGDGALFNLAYSLNPVEPLSFGLSVSREAFRSFSSHETSLKQRWVFDASVCYQMDWVSMGLIGWWGTPDERGSTAITGAFPAGMLHPSGFILPLADGYGDAFDLSGFGTRGLGLEMASSALIDDLVHRLRVVLYSGTNESEIGALARQRAGRTGVLGEQLFLTNEDRVIQVNLDHQYKLYENLNAFLELGYMRMDGENEAWRNGSSGELSDDAWKARFSVQFNF